MGRPPDPILDLAIPIGTGATAALLQMSAPKLIALTHAGIFHQLRDDAGIPIGGKYLLNQAVANYINYLAHRSGNYDEARSRRALASAAVNEMRVMRMSAELIEADPVLEVMNAIVLRFRAKLMAASSRFARECYGAANVGDAEERAATLVDEILGELRQLKAEELHRASLRVLPDGDQTEN